MNEIICEDLIKNTNNCGIMGTFVLMNKFKNSQLRDRQYNYFCILRDVALNYHPTKFGDNCKTHC